MGIVQLMRPRGGLNGLSSRISNLFGPKRMAIIELRAARGWSQAETSRVFRVEPGTIRTWWKRIDEEGDSPLVKTPVPVNMAVALQSGVDARSGSTELQGYRPVNGSEGP